MAKRQRERTRQAPQKTKKAPPARRRTGRSSASPLAHQPAPVSPQGLPPAQVVRQSHREAVAVYDRALQALQGHDYGQAADLLRSLLKDYAEETELTERAQLYLNVCGQKVGPAPQATPQSTEEQLYAATLALNSGQYAQALEHVRDVIDAEPDNDHAHYVGAVAFTLSGRVAEALPRLVRAIELNSDNRSLARQDADLDGLRQDHRFRHSFDAATIPPRPEKRRTSRSRTSR